MGRELQRQVLQDPKELVRTLMLANGFIGMKQLRRLYGDSKSRAFRDAYEWIMYGGEFGERVGRITISQGNTYHSGGSKTSVYELFGSRIDETYLVAQHRNTNTGLIDNDRRFERHIAWTLEHLFWEKNPAPDLGMQRALTHLMRSNGVERNGINAKIFFDVKLLDKPSDDAILIIELLRLDACKVPTATMAAHLQEGESRIMATNNVRYKITKAKRYEGFMDILSSGLLGTAKQPQDKYCEGAGKEYFKSISEMMSQLSQLIK